MSPERNRYSTAWSLLALLATLGLAMLAVSPADVRAAPLEQPGVPAAAEVQDPTTCAECHAQEFDAWQTSTHAQATISSDFRQAWERSGWLGDCLACHSTAYDASTGQTGAAGITCQACHKTGGAEHPPAVMSVRIASEACGECHVNTLKEWQISGHGARGVECAGCHQSHSQALRIQPANDLCASCHGRRLQDAPHTSHARQPLACTSCHMPANPAAQVTRGIGAVGVVGHTFSVGAQTCTWCHQDEIHQSASRMVSAQTAPTLAELRVDSESLALQAAREQLRTVQSEQENLERQVERQQVLTYLGGAFGFGIGAFAGIIGALVLIYVLQRRSTA